ncbi:MAG: acyl-CoA thioesterase/bile acid-CoA:amino acid N-acyltransferase family protein [Myxococcota bacterium]
MRRLTPLLLAATMAGCGDTTAPVDAVVPDVADTSPDGAEASPDSADAAPSAPRIRFFVDERPQDDADLDVDATLRGARWSDPIRVVVDGLAAGQQVTLAFSAAAGTSQARFAADGDGVIDLGRDAPLSGDWAVADRDAFLWSMVGAVDPSAPIDLTISAFVVDGERQIASATLSRHTTDADIVVEPVADDTTVGVLALPPGDGPFGAVLCFGGSEGGTASGLRCARHIASLGYAALGVGYFRAPGLPPTLKDVPLEILEKDLAYLTADARVAAGGVVVVGASRGGELALLLGARFPAVKGVVAQVPSGYVWGAAAGEGAAWTYAGEPLPSIPSSGSLTGDPLVSSEGVLGTSTRRIFLDAVAQASEPERAAASIPIEAVAGPVVLLGGADDQLWPSCELADVAYQRLLAAGHVAAHGDRLVCSPDAGHFSTGTPGWTAVGSTVYDDAVNGFRFVVGGTVAGNGMAQRQNDTALRALLEDVLGPGRIVAPSSAPAGP